MTDRATDPGRLHSAARRGVYLAPFGEVSDPRVLTELAARAEDRGWDGFFLWDHIAYDGVAAVADPWIALAGIACATQRLIIGPLVTPLPRRRIQKLARETVSLDLLSGGRTVFGAGIGGDRGGELSRFGEELDPRERGRLLDDGLERLARYWGGELEPQALQQPRIPVWLAVRWPNRKPVRRAAAWDGLFPIEMPGPDSLAQLVAEVKALRAPDAGPFDFVVTAKPGTEWEPWIAAGATWCLTGFAQHPTLAGVRAAIDAGP
jgi:alkanesulfonate monooxygenase SsuD/methylene tetrahydromethanopterin reductase-like flavin-dependent oxidoreductase (luciferase family)